MYATAQFVVPRSMPIAISTATAPPVLPFRRRPPCSSHEVMACRGSGVTREASCARADWRSRSSRSRSAIVCHARTNSSSASSAPSASASSRASTASPSSSSRGLRTSRPPSSAVRHPVRCAGAQVSPKALRSFLARVRRSAFSLESISRRHDAIIASCSAAEGSGLLPSSAMASSSCQSESSAATSVVGPPPGENSFRRTSRETTVMPKPYSLSSSSRSSASGP